MFPWIDNRPWQCLGWGFLVEYIVCSCCHWVARVHFPLWQLNPDFAFGHHLAPYFQVRKTNDPTEVHHMLSPRVKSWVEDCMSLFTLAVALSRGHLVVSTTWFPSTELALKLLFQFFELPNIPLISYVFCMISTVSFCCLQLKNLEQWK